MAPFSPAQSSSVPMKTRLKLKLQKIMQSDKREARRTKARVEDGCHLRRTISSPSLTTLNETTWTKGRGKGGKKLGVGGGLIKSLPEQGFKEWTKLHKLSTKKLVEKRRDTSLNKSLGNSPSLTKTKRVFGN